MTKNNTAQRVIIVGGGLAGIACATACSAAGADVTLLEARQSLGGRAGSFEDAATGEQLDNCQHVLLGCCTNLLDLYRRLGVSDRISWHDRVHFLDARGRRHDLWRVPGLPAPLHLGPAMAFFGALSLGERIALSRAMVAMLRLGRAGRDALEGQAFGAWLDEHRQPSGLVRKFYDPVLMSALNEDTRQASTKYAVQVFQDAMLSSARGYVMGLPNCPLAALYKNLPGAQVRLGTRVERLVLENGRATGVVLRDQTELRADHIVLAANHHAVQRWVPAELSAGDPRFSGLDKLQSVPILGAHLWFDRPVLTEPAVALLEGPLQWLFKKDVEGRAVHGVISAAREWVNVQRDEAISQFTKQIKQLAVRGRAGTPELVRGITVIEKRATFSPLPGSEALRPAQAPPAGGVQNLYLAGDYTRTGWPATMEGAVRSGYLAAEAVLGARFLVPDLPVQWPARLVNSRF